MIWAGHSWSIKRGLNPLSPEPPLLLMAVLVFLNFFYFTVLNLDSVFLVRVANIAGPIIMGLVACMAIYRILHQDTEVLWTPYAWFLGAIIMFYSLGPLVYPFAGPLLLDYMNTFMPITETELLHTNLLNGFGVLSIFVGFKVAGNFWLNHTKHNIVSSNGKVDDVEYGFEFNLNVNESKLV